MSTAFNESVADRIEALLARVDGVRRGSDCPRPTRFDRRGEQHARSVAARDAKAVDTGLAPNVSRGELVPNPGDSRSIEATSVLVTGASPRLRQLKGAAQ